MENKNYDRVVALLKCLMAAYIVTGILLLVVAALFYKLSLGEEIVSILIIVVYVISSWIIGFLYAKGASSRRFIWGTLAGFVYFLIICVISLFVDHNFNPFTNESVTTLLICTGSGCLGGMLG